MNTETNFETRSSLMKWNSNFPVSLPCFVLSSAELDEKVSKMKCSLKGNRLKGTYLKQVKCQISTAIKCHLVAEKFCPLHHGQSEGEKFSYEDARAFNCLLKYYIVVEACILP